MPDRLSQWDKDNLNMREQRVVTYQKKQYANATTDAQRQAANQAAEKVRAKYKYSGGIDGSQYIPLAEQQTTPTQSYSAQPSIPTQAPYESQYGDRLDGMLSDFENQGNYQSPYESLLNEQISKIMGQGSFEYDSETDQAYQAYKERALRAGDKAFDDNLAGMAAMTGGRANSWAGSVASQARNEYVLQAQEAVTHFEDRAYSRHRDETADMYNLVNLLSAQDDKSYSKFRDTVTDKKDLFDMVLKLDDRDFDNYKYMADQTWKRFDAETTQYKIALEEKKDKIAEAMERTNLNGFVSNQDSLILGVPSGTLSKDAKKRAEDMNDYIIKSEHDVSKEFEIMKERNKYDLEMLDAREKIDKAKRIEEESRDYRLMNAREQLAYRTSGGASGGYTGSSSDYKGLGSIVGKYESGGDPGRVSTGTGDLGGVSYGIYQFSSKTGGATNFMNYLKSNNKGYYDELSKSGSPGSSGYTAKWKEIAARDPEGFEQLQHQAIKQLYYDPAVADIKKKNGIDVNSRSIALQETIMSTAVQHGTDMVSTIVARALNSNPSGKQDDATLISSIYDERGANNGAKYFKSSSKQVQESVANRFRNEKQDVLNLLETSGGGPINSQPTKPLTKADGTERDKRIKDYTEYTNSVEFERLKPSEKQVYIEGTIQKIVDDVSWGLYGDNSNWIGGQILKSIEESPAYIEYEKNMRAKSQSDAIFKDGSIFDRFDPQKQFQDNMYDLLNKPTYDERVKSNKSIYGMGGR